MFFDIKIFAIKLAALVVVAPFVGFAMLKFADHMEVAWKTNNRKKKWIVMSTIFAFIAGLAGWLH